MTMKTKSCNELLLAVHSAVDPMRAVDGRVGAVADAVIPLVESVLVVIGVRRWLLVAVPDDKKKGMRKKLVKKQKRLRHCAGRKNCWIFMGYSLGISSILPNL
jgi:hypothetical protein